MKSISNESTVILITTHTSLIVLITSHTHSLVLREKPLRNNFFFLLCCSTQIRDCVTDWVTDCVTECVTACVTDCVLHTWAPRCLVVGATNMYSVKDSVPSRATKKNKWRSLVLAHCTTPNVKDALYSSTEQSFIGL